MAVTITGSSGNDTINLTAPTPPDDVVVNLLGGVDIVNLNGVSPVTVINVGTVTINGTAANERVTVNSSAVAASMFLLGLGTDTLSAGADVATFDLSSTTVTGVEVLSGTRTSGTEFILDVNDFLQGGEAANLATIAGAAGTDTLTFAGTQLDLRSTTLSSVEVIAAQSSAGTVFIVNQADLVSGGEVRGHASGSDTLNVLDATIDLTGTTLNSIESLVAGGTAATTFRLDATDISRLGAANASIIGIAGQSDVLQVTSNDVNLRNIALQNVETIQSLVTTATTFRVDQADLAANATVIGGDSSLDTINIAGTQLDLRSVTMMSVERIAAGSDRKSVV